jgi:hypothetical protein
MLTETEIASVSWEVCTSKKVNNYHLERVYHREIKL